MVNASPQQLDLFVANAFDIKAKQATDLMSRNLFSLSKQKRTKEIHHQSADSFIRVTGSEEHGLATMHDQDILIFLISQLIHARNRGDNIGRRVWFSGYELWRFIGKQKASGKGYNELWAALQRLHNTHIETDLRVRHRRKQHQFTWLSEIEQRWSNDRHIGYEVLLPEFLFDVVKQEKPLVVTLDQRYFSLTSALERWLYLFSRKAAGIQTEGWTETIESLHAKSASTATRSSFALSVRKILEKHQNKLLDYHLHTALLGRKPALHFERSKLLPKERQPMLVLLD